MLIRYVLCLFLPMICIRAADVNMPSMDQQLVIHNRILTKISGKTISVLDVVKRMQVFLERNYPQHAHVPMAQYQYYSAQWKNTLMQIIDHELILLDAEKLELKVTDAEVRETLFERFGPNIMASLDKIQLSYEEARSMIYADLVVQRMSWFKAHAKALSSVNSKDIKDAYTTYCNRFPPKEEWEYQVLSIRANNEEVAEKLAHKAFSLCQNHPENLPSVVDILQKEQESDPNAIRISLSAPIKTEEKDLSQSYKDILTRLALQTISQPVRQPSKTNQPHTYRIFYLKDHVKAQTPSLRSLYEQLQQQLVQEKAEESFTQYIAKLRKRYGFDPKHVEDNLPSGFQPFSIQ